MSLRTPPSESTTLSDMFSLKGKVCLITGGTRGIGLAVAQSFAEAGALALALVHSSPSQAAAAEEVVSTLRDKYPGTTITLHRADVSQSTQIEGVIQKVFSDTGRLDVVVPNAGVYTDTPALEMSPEEAQQITNVNYFGVLYTAQSAASIMKDNGGGRIIITGSINGHIVLRPQYESIYCATKAGVIHLARALAVEFAPFNIQVNSVSPGYVNTEMNDELIRKNPGQAENWFKDCPAGRFCETWELKGIYVFLASAASSYVTGSDYLVDGGHTCH